MLSIDKGGRGGHEISYRGFSNQRHTFLWDLLAKNVQHLAPLPVHDAKVGKKTETTKLFWEKCYKAI